MPLILNIDTATGTASIALAGDKGVPEVMMNPDQKDHAAWIHSAIDAVMKKTGHALRELDAIAVTEGPGSYTGLRVGMATAKGFCYALGLPLITESTLKVMAHAAYVQHRDAVAGALLCPMIDARRMEVFTAVYDEALKEIMPPGPLVLDAHSFEELLSKNRLIFFGSGSDKFSPLVQSSNAVFIESGYHAGHLGDLAMAKFHTRDFTDAAYAEPAYLKEFYTHTRK
jgi:tRNA threonylcarbamoyladenosine biosynthesis protein TsaB